MRQQLDLGARKTIHEVVDGQQRVTAVLDFLRDKLRLNRSHGEFGGRTFDELPPEAQAQFLAYEFSVDLLVDASDADVLDVFARINSYSVPLNAQEKRNATFFGSFKQVVYRLGWEHLEFWKRHKILTDKSIARMKEAELTSELIVAMIDGLQDKKKSLNNFYRDWDEDFPYEKKAVTQFQETIDLIGTIFADHLRQSNFHRTALFYSLFFAVFSLRFGSSETPRDPAMFIKGNHGQLVRQLKRLSDIIDSRNPPAKYRDFVAASQRQTDNIQPRRTRHRALVIAFKTAAN
jgi:hypothetical protein